MSDVFISYARPDRARAKVLAEALERAGLSVWWDRDILVGQAFDEVIERELETARTVVVLWSRHSVVSEWVKNEAHVAADRGTLVPAVLDAARIPLQFRRKQAADLVDWHGDPDHAGFVMLRRGIAAHLVTEGPGQPVGAPGIPPMQPSPRDPGRPFRWRTGLWAGAGALLALTIGALGLWDAFYRQHITHYANVTKHAGLPQGVGQLNREQVRRRNVTLAFFRHGRRGPVTEIRAVNSRGAYPPEFAYYPPASLVGLNPLVTKTAEFLNTCRVTFKYDDGRIVRQTAYDRSDRVLYALDYSEPGVAAYRWGAFSRMVSASGITHIRFVRSETGPQAGFDTDVLFLDDAEKPSPNDDGSYGYRRVFGRLGLVVELIPLGPDHEPRPNRLGIARFVAEYDHLGNFTRQASLAADGRPVVEAHGAAEARARHDQHGNMTELLFLGADGQPVTSQLVGAAGRTMAYDDRGNLVENTFFGPDRQLVIGRLGVAKQTIVWDDRGSSVESYFGADGKPLLSSGRVFKIKSSWDRRGRLVEMTYLDHTERPVRSSDGCVRKRLGHDEYGNVADIACLDERDQAIRDTSGAARIKRTFDERGNQVEERYFGPDDQPELYEERYALARWTYDRQGRETEVAYFDAAGKPVRRRDGYAKVTYRYDSHGNRREIAFFDETSQPVMRKGGYAQLVRAYDPRNYIIEESLLDRHGQPVRDEDGYATARFAYDARGYPIETSYYDERDRPTTSRGCGRIRQQYNDKGQWTLWACLSTDGAPAVGKEGYATARRFYDGSGKLMRLDLFDTTGGRTRGIRGYARISYAYDDWGREVKRTFFDVNGEPVATRVMISKVEPGSKSERVGLQIGDALIAYDGQDIADERQLNELEVLGGERPRQLTIERKGKIVSLDVPAGRLRGLEVVDAVPAAHERSLQEKRG